MRLNDTSSKVDLLYKTDGRLHKKIDGILNAQQDMSDKKKGGGHHSRNDLSQISFLKQ